MIFDPLYLVAIWPGLLLGLWASARVKSTFEPVSGFPWRAGLVGSWND